MALVSSVYGTWKNGQVTLTIESDSQTKLVSAVILTNNSGLEVIVQLNALNGKTLIKTYQPGEIARLSIPIGQRPNLTTELTDIGVVVRWQ